MSWKNQIMEGTLDQASGRRDRWWVEGERKRERDGGEEKG